MALLNDQKSASYPSWLHEIFIRFEGCKFHCAYSLYGPVQKQHNHGKHKRMLCSAGENSGPCLLMICA